ncbi:hypothetical protein [Leptospira idonii]|uniref:Uncharacterized protein n=1 Tax=Leptospira idonii TaxID=1193500 RepID=A0A4R9LTP9_9LEPT|nr:hypothetical protein [Leptospira idonii]TGN17072.1 hypothetical protein EHS15_17985 [Leptospira idonii]
MMEMGNPFWERKKNHNPKNCVQLVWLYAQNHMKLARPKVNFILQFVTHLIINVYKLHFFVLLGIISQMRYNKAIVVVLLCLFFLSCKNKKHEEGECLKTPSQVEDDGSRPKDTLNICRHKLMKAKILPHPPEMLEGKVIQFCFFEEENGVYTFYKDSSKSNKLAVVPDKESILW